MSFVSLLPSLTGYHFEARIASLFYSLEFTVKFSNGQFKCLSTPYHNLHPTHELDHVVEFKEGGGGIYNLLPVYARDVMAVSCKKTLTDMNAVCVEKKKLLGAIECYNKHATTNARVRKISHGIIMCGNVVSPCSPDLGDGIFFWDLARCFFYGWKAYFANNLGTTMNYGEQGLGNKSRAIFGAGDKDLPHNQGIMEIFHDSEDQLDADTLEKYLTKFRKSVQSRSLIKNTGTIYVNIHTINGFTSQAEVKKDVIARKASDAKISFSIRSFYNYSVAPWDPLTRLF